MKIRIVSLNNKKYLRLEDVVAMLQELGAAEPTGTRRRIEILADNLTRSGKQEKPK
jgi:hypothetical protein